MSLHTLFHPKSIAIVGVSHNPKKVGYLVAKNIIDQGYTGELYFVHPSGEEILGHTTYTTILSIKKSIDLVILAIPGEAAVDYLDQVKQVGCQHVVLYAAGFKENNDEKGFQLEQALQQKIEEHALTILGPNCLGFINTQVGINATFLKSVAPTGNIGFVSQSGALGSVMVDYFSSHHNLGFSYFVSLGNKTCIDESDLLSFLTEKANTEVIGMYLEGVQDGKRFREALQAATKVKPVIILKSGTTEAGSKAALSHTGGMVGDDAAFDAICKQSGAIRARSFSEFLTLLKLTSFKRTPQIDNILVLSNAGGVGVLLADDLIHEGLHLTTVSEKTKKQLLHAFDELKKITVHNPIDLLGDASAFDYQKAIAETMKEKDIGAVIVLLTTQANTEIDETAQVLIHAQQKFKHIPILPVFMGEQSVVNAHEQFEKAKIASFYQYDVLPSALSKIINSQKHQKTVETKNVTSTLSFTAHTLDIETILLKNEGKPFLNQYDSLKVLEYLDINTSKTYLAHTEKDLQTIMKDVGFPLVAKIASDKITHKTEVKGVMTGLTNYDELLNAFSYLSLVSGEKACYIQKQLEGHELFIGAKRDATFGPVVIIGFGGVYAELVHEIVEGVYPFSYEYFERKIHKTKIAKLLKGFRKTPPVDPHSLYEIAVKIGLLMYECPGIKEIDINPLMVSGNVSTVVDARVII